MEGCVWKRRWENAQRIFTDCDMVESLLNYCHTKDCDVVEDEMENCETCDEPICEACMEEHESTCVPLKKIKA